MKHVSRIMDYFKSRCLSTSYLIIFLCLNLSEFDFKKDVPLILVWYVGKRTTLMSYRDICTFRTSMDRFLPGRRIQQQVQQRMDCVSLRGDSLI